MTMTMSPNTRRILERITVSDETGCWLWTAGINGRGYGNITADGRTRSAHRVAYEEWIGPIPAGLDLDHLCRVRHCVNPDHLEPVTRRENLVRGATLVAEQVARTACPQGHLYDEENTRYEGSMRHCRRCNNSDRRGESDRV